MEWMLDIQLGRRNLSPIQRIAVTEKYRPIYEKQAKKNIEEGGRKGGLITQNKPSSNLTNPLNSIDTNKKLADIAGVKPTTYKMGAKVLNSDNDELKRRVLSGETSISAGYKELTQGKEVLKDLIETNIRQRGIGNPNPIKLSRCIKELERIYGIEHGGNHGNQYYMPNPKVSDLPTQEGLANMIGISVDTLNNYKKLTELVPELQDWVETGILAPTTAIALIEIYRMRTQNFVL